MEHAGVAVSTIGSWTQTFPGDDPWVVEVVPTATDPAEAAAAANLRPYVELLAGAGVRASSRVIQGGEPGFWLEDFAEHIADPILVATSARWTDDQRHWHSETRELVGQSTHPVLVVPAAGGAPPPDSPPPLPPPRLADVSLATDDPIAIEELPVVTCWELVRTRRVGRLAINVNGRARIFPINFVVYGQTIVFRTAPGTKLSAARRADVEFEVDHYDASTGRALERDHGRPGNRGHAGRRVGARPRPAAVSVAPRAEAVLRAHRPRDRDRAPLPRRVRRRGPRRHLNRPPRDR